MNIAIVGCGFVFDIYMRTAKAHPELVIVGVFDVKAERMNCVCAHYGLEQYASLDSLLEDASVDAVVNLTNIGSHFEVSRQALLAGKHVYSEKPITRDIQQTRELFSIAHSNKVRLYGAPCNIYSDSVRTLFKAVGDGAIGKPLLVYAELDDNPIHLMEFEKVKSPTGAPWPLEEEIIEGCTFEHVGYHLVWICGLLGPVTAVTAYSNELIESKSKALPGRSGTPDYSVACLTFASGATARITCSVVAPRDHRMRVIGTEGEISTDSYRQYRSPVHLERYSKGSLSARKLQLLRNSRPLGKLFGIGGHRMRLVRNWKSEAVEKDQSLGASLTTRLKEWVRRKEVYAQDKFVGIAEMALELATDQPQYLSPEFIAHLNELTLLIQGAGPEGLATRPTTTFVPLGPPPGTQDYGTRYMDHMRPTLLEKIASR